MLYEAAYTINAEPQQVVDTEAGRFLRGKSNYLIGCYHLVSENLREWQVLYVPTRH